VSGVSQVWVAGSLDSSRRLLLARVWSTLGGDCAGLTGGRIRDVVCCLDALGRG